MDASLQTLPVPQPPSTTPFLHLPVAALPIILARDRQWFAHTDGLVHVAENPPAMYCPSRVQQTRLVQRPAVPDLCRGFRPRQMLPPHLSPPLPAHLSPGLQRSLKTHHKSVNWQVCYMRTKLLPILNKLHRFCLSCSAVSTFIT